MSLKCLFGHKWNGCKCARCEATRDEGHKWKLLENKCIEKCSVCGIERKIKHKWKLLESKCVEKCSVCGIERKTSKHKWNGCKCEKCETTRKEGHKWKLFENKCIEKCSICDEERSTKHKWKLVSEYHTDSQGSDCIYRYFYKNVKCEKCGMEDTVLVNSQRD